MSRRLVLHNTNLSDKEVINEIKACISESGRHIFLFVMDMGRFTAEKKEMVETVKTALGKKVTDYMILVLTHGNIPQEEMKLIPEFIPEFIAESKDLRAFSDECGSRHVGFNTEDENPSQVTELLQLIDNIQDGKGDCFTHKMLKQAESRLGLPAKVALWVNGGALAGAGVGGAVAQFVGGVIGITGGAAAGGAAGGVLGCVGVVAAQHKREKCPLW